MRNFPISRGTVAGILKGYIGLSAAVYTEIYTGVLHNSSAKLLLFLTLGLPTICLMMMFFVRPCTPASEEDSSERGHFLFTQILSVTLGVYLLLTTILNDTLSLNDSISYAFFGVMILFLLAPLGIPIKMTLYPTKPKRIEPSSSHEELSQLDQGKTEPLLGSLQETLDENDVDILLAEGEGAVIPGKKKRKPKRGEDFNFKQAVVKADFWLLFMVYFLGVGSGVTVLNNLAQVGIAVGEDDTTLLLCLLSFCNFAGRLGGGVVSEYFVRLRMLPRTIWMIFAQLIMIFVYLLYASALDGTLYASTALLGICYGVQYSVMVPTASELFGLKHFGKIYNFMILGNPIGALLFSGLLAGYVYDKEAAKQHSGSFCYGPECFRLTFLVLSGVNVIGCALGIILTVRIRPVYQMLYSSGSFKLLRTSLH
ncbi:uncharacterized protein A4U43_C05F33250 [Asparagus officinalis]|uniref:Uncharacterized protein n=1 Tax=Asparagus officinalis TaxID=4686 RepID=A0A5P1EY59_ASPOF|nr:protein NUCLEAR FUSION DEFECTIVE 4-like [Asparagus officinalis]ONK70393.1 uncharacterized protein A4U43_C05F33250 [Asparagus officinalis]